MHNILLYLPIVVLILGFYNLSQALWALHREGTKSDFIISMMSALILIFIATPYIMIMIGWNQLFGW